jgi:4a-hydroxytetrahydrobiopterin dehydratase
MKGPESAGAPARIRWAQLLARVCEVYPLRFRDAIVFVNRLASLADTADHHPDIDIRYSKVHVGLSTHDAGGLSEKDTAMAEKIDLATSR